MIEYSYPLSPLQQGMLFHYLEAKSPGVDVEQLEVQLNEPIDPELFKCAWKIVAAQHPALRTRFNWKNLQKPSQEILDQVNIPFVVRDLSALSPAQQNIELGAFLADDRVAPLPLEVAPLWRVTLFRLAADRY